MNELITLEEKMENALANIKLCQAQGCTNPVTENRKTCGPDCLQKVRHANAQRNPWRLNGYK